MNTSWYRTNLINDSQFDELRFVFLSARCFVSGCSRLWLIAAALFLFIIFPTINTCILLLRYKSSPLNLYNCRQEAQLWPVAIPFGVQKLEWCCYPAVKKV